MKSINVYFQVIPKISSRILKVGDILTVENFSHIFSKAVIRDGLVDVKVSFLFQIQPFSADETC